jgi:hypothetical protein
MSSSTVISPPPHSPPRQLSSPSPQLPSSPKIHPPPRSFIVSNTSTHTLSCSHKDRTQSLVFVVECRSSPSATDLLPWWTPFVVEKDTHSPKVISCHCTQTTVYIMPYLLPQTYKTTFSNYNFLFTLFSLPKPKRASKLVSWKAQAQASYQSLWWLHK